jgi:DNA-binding LacI/PurR family transcriptional regulator
MTAMQSSGATVAFFGELIDAMAYADLVKARGMGIPHDVSIVALGSRNRVLSHHLAFASYDIPREQMARDATDLLVRTLDDPGLMEQVRLPCKVTLGETLGPPGTDKRVVIK